MKRREFLLAVASLAVVPKALANSDFEAYKQRFETHKTEVYDQFDSYKEKSEKAFEKFKKEVSKIWGDENIGSSKVWTEYSQDKKTRTIADFENDVLKVEVVDVPNSQTASTKIREALNSVTKKSSDQAYKSDELAQEIDKNADKIASKPETKPILAEILAEKTDPTPKEQSVALTNAIQKSTATTRSAPDGMVVYSLSIPLSKTAVDSRYLEYKPTVIRYSKMHNVDPALALAIMHSESNFNPVAKSGVPAFGLMQIVPQSAGRDATKKVYGKERLLSASYLYNSDNNIKIGTAYMSILFHNYLSSITNPESRIYCTIAAYNTGAGNVSRAFGNYKTPKTASETINKMSPQQVYSRLISHLPYSETRNYLKIVVPRFESYRKTI